ncbi:MAG: SHOCT domain-containing protein [Bacilli bacterium]|nr:SHOCT domain-containing protein [Bacilli bacterium]
MIIGNNKSDNKFKDNNFLNDTFDTKYNQYKDNSKLTNKKNIFVKDIKEQAHTNVNSQDDMYNKSLAILNDRLKNGLITLEEFNRQVKELARKRK